MLDWLHRARGHAGLTWVLLPLLVLLGVPGCKGGKGRGRGGARKAQGRVQAVHIQTVRQRTIADDILATGVARPLREVSISTQVGGAIVRYEVSLGRVVHKGDLLVRVSTVGLYGESRQAAAAIGRLRTEIRQADQELKDTRRLFEHKLVSRKSLDDARFKLLRLKAQRAEAKARLGGVGERYLGGVFRAPFSGVIAAQSAELGDYAAPGKVLGRLVDLSAVKVVVSLAEVDMVRLLPTMPVEVRFPALGERFWPGKIIAVAPTADSRTGSFPVEVRVLNPEGKLRGGMAARVAFKRPGISGIFVPVEAVVRRGGRPVAYVLPASSDRVKLKVCRVSLLRDGLIRVDSGLRVGDRLVVSGNTRLRDGSRVREVGAVATARGPGGDASEGRALGDSRDARMGAHQKTQ